jgi:predicted MFS family arabinose efflux permease
MYVPFGTMIALLVGGFLGEELGWRGAFMVMGVVGLVLTPLAFLLVKNARIVPATPEAALPPRAPILPHLKKPGLSAGLAAATLIGITGYSTTMFAPAFLMRSHDMSLSEVGLSYGLASGAVGIVSLILVGALADRLSAKDPRWLLGVVVVMIACILPFSLTAFLVGDRSASVLCVAMSNVVQTAYLAPVIAAMHRMVPPDARATASAILLFFSATVGSFGPVMTGMISDHLKPVLGDDSLGRALMAVVPTGHFLAAVIFLFAALRFHKEIVPETPAGP